MRMPGFRQVERSLVLCLVAVLVWAGGERRTPAQEGTVLVKDLAGRVSTATDLGASATSTDSAASADDVPPLRVDLGVVAGAALAGAGGNVGSAAGLGGFARLYLFMDRDWGLGFEFMRDDLKFSADVSGFEGEFETPDLVAVHYIKKADTFEWYCLLGGARYPALTLTAPDGKVMPAAAETAIVFGGGVNVPLAKHVLFTADARSVLLTYKPELPPGYVVTGYTDQLDAGHWDLWLGFSVTF